MRATHNWECNDCSFPIGVLFVVCCILIQRWFSKGKQLQDFKQRMEEATAQSEKREMNVLDLKRELQSFQQRMRETTAQCKKIGDKCA